MDLIDQLKELSLRISKVKDTIQTEEATKNAMIMPFIQILGYNVFDPTEVTPELNADIGLKKGEKVDYAILKDGKPIMLFECKRSGGDLSISHASQLFRYFHVTEARFGVLTNGIAYRFFTDLEHPNKMDERPFLEFNILDFNEKHVDELKKFAKPTFNLEQILNTASDLKYTKAVKNLISEWINKPSENLVKIICREMCGGKNFTPALKEQFTYITKAAFEQIISEKITDRLKIAMEPQTDIKQEINEDTATSEIVTTPDEMEAFRIVRAILREITDPKRIVMRDAKSYCAILFDDNNRQTVCRLRFGSTRNAIGIYNNKEETIHQLSDLSDIYNHSDSLKETVSGYLENKQLE